MTDSPAIMLLGDAVGPERARRLLAMPDSVLLANSLELADGVRHEREAFHYIIARTAALNARRDASGQLPPGVSIVLENARLDLRQVAKA